MSLPRLQLRPVSTDHFYISGDVTIQSGVAIAPGVLIQADPHSRVVIKAGACIGIGSILHAHQGVVEVGEGANIGAEVLLIGQVTIGANACIGSATTILNSAIAWGQVVPPGSLIGDTGRQEEVLQIKDAVIDPVDHGLAAPSPALSSNGQATVLPEISPEVVPEAVSDAPSVNVYGQVYVNRLLVKMFPHSQPQNSPITNPPSLPNDPWDD